MKKIKDDRARFEKWHNEFYGPQDKYNPIRSLELHDEETGLGYVDTTVQAQFCAFQGASGDLLSALIAITNSGPDAIPIKEAFEMAHRAIERALAS